MKKLLMSIMMILTIVIALCACGEVDVPGGTGNDTEQEAKDVTLTTVDDIAEYKIVRGENCSEGEKQALVDLNLAIREKLGLKLSVATDYSNATKEILVGNTNRQQSIDAAEGLRYGDYVIKQDGDKIVIIGGSDEAVATAVSYFIENYIDTENKTVKAPQGKGLVHTQEYKLNSFIVGDVNIKEFKIKVLYDTEGVEEFCDNIRNNYIGYDLPITEDAILNDEHYIIIDSSQLDYDDYSISVKDGDIYITGSYVSISGAFEEFYKIMDSTADGNLALAASGIISGKIEAPEIPYKNKDELLAVLEYLHEDDRLIFGQHLAGSLDLNKSVDEYTGEVGEGPAIMDIDFISLRTSSRDKWSFLLCQAVEYAAKGGVITTMHHWLNPADPASGSYRGRLESADDWQEVLTPGTALNTEWHKELDRAAEFLKALDDAGVSVMFRPMHEANGSWFWFCAGYGELGTIDSRDMIDMWIYVHNYYTNEWGLDNILWSYGPNISNSETSPFPVTYYYPGDEYCDVVGIDWYTDGSYDAINGAGKSWDSLLEYRKPAGLTEWGIGDNLQMGDIEEQIKVWNCENYIEFLEKMISEGKSIAFAEVYSGRFGAPAYVGNGEAIANSDLIISLEEMPAFIAEVLGR